MGPLEVFRRGVAFGLGLAKGARTVLLALDFGSERQLSGLIASATIS